MGWRYLESAFLIVVDSRHPFHSCFAARSPEPTAAPDSTADTVLS